MANKTVLLKDRQQLIDKITKAGFSYRALANKAECSQTQISLILKGERNPSPKNAVNICRALQCNFDDIFFINHDYKSN